MTAQPKPTAADVPSTGEVRRHYADYAGQVNQRAREFDRWLAEHDAQVAAQASEAADEALVRIAGATDRQIVGDDVWQHSTLGIARNAGSVIEAVNDALLDYRDGWAIDEAERRAGGAT